MALIHCIYIGDFIPEQGFVRFQDHRPVVNRPVSQSTVEHLLEIHLREGGSPDALPKDWAMSILPDYIVCVMSASAEALRFVADYAEQERSIIIDMGSFSLLSPEQIRQSASSMRQSQPA